MILSDFHSVSVPATSQSIVVADMVADMAAKMDLHMVAVMEVNKVANIKYIHSGSYISIFGPHLSADWQTLKIVEKAKEIEV